MEDFICNICSSDLTTENIQTERKFDIDIAFIICPECDNRFNLMFDNKKTEQIKRKIKTVKEIEEYLQLILYREMLIVEDDYYKQTYDNLPDDEKKLIGEYQHNIDKEKIKKYNDEIKSKKYSPKDLARLLWQTFTRVNNG